MNRTAKIRLSCIGRRTTIQIIKRYRAAAQLPQPQLVKIDFTSCANSLQCGIATEVSYGNWTFDWDRCPAYARK